MTSAAAADQIRRLPPLVIGPGAGVGCSRALRDTSRVPTRCNDVVRSAGNSKGRENLDKIDAERCHYHTAVREITRCLGVLSA
jgi:hypothetical protein